MHTRNHRRLLSILFVSLKRYGDNIAINHKQCRKNYPPTYKKTCLRFASITSFFSIVARRHPQYTFRYLLYSIIYSYANYFVIWIISQMWIISVFSARGYFTTGSLGDWFPTPPVHVSNHLLYPLNHSHPNTTQYSQWWWSPIPTLLSFRDETRLGVLRVVWL